MGLCSLPAIYLGAICLQCGRPGFDPWVGKVPWRRKWQPTPVILPGKSHGQRSLVGYNPWGHKESNTTERLLSLTQTVGEVMQILVTSFKRSLHALLQSVPQPCSRPAPSHASTGDSGVPTGKSRTVSCGVTAPFPWVLVHKVLLCLQESISQSCVSSGKEERKLRREC